MDDARLPIFNIQAGDSSVFGRGEYSQSVEPSNPVRRLPTLLELGSDQAIAGIAGSVAPLRERSFIASLLYLELHNALFFTLGSIYLRSASTAASIAIGWTARRSSRATAASIRVAAEHEAPRQPQHLVSTLTPIDGLSRRRPE
jgi:hypothetical protein